MKVQSKDDIITCLIDLLKQDIEHKEMDDYYVNKGWVEALTWVLNLVNEQKDVDTKS